MKLVLFEDTREQAEPLISAIQRQLGPGEEVVHYESAETDDERMYEERLREELSSTLYCDASLIVADRDLSKTPGYRGLDEPIVKRVAELLAIPECSYARTVGQEEFLQAAGRREASIAVSISEGEEQCAQQVVAIARGFDDIRAKLHDTSFAKAAAPGKILAAILGKPEYAEKISLYASGDMNRFAGIFRLRDADATGKIPMLSCLLGYWLWDSILRFPGVVVNAVAASSYLNIRESLFLSESAVRDVFREAIYAGPFAGAMGELWWRGMLDDMVAAEDCADGREFVAKHLKRDIAGSECCEAPQQPAGYYCMISGRPVSLANSKGSLPWFPRGADLARVSLSQYEELAPWL